MALTPLKTQWSLMCHKRLSLGLSIWVFLLMAFHYTWKYNCWLWHVGRWHNTKHIWKRCFTNQKQYTRQLRWGIELVWQSVPDRNSSCHVYRTEPQLSRLPDRTTAVTFTGQNHSCHVYRTEPQLSRLPDRNSSCYVYRTEPQLSRLPDRTTAVTFTAMWSPTRTGSILLTCTHADCCCQLFSSCCCLPLVIVASVNLRDILLPFLLIVCLYMCIWVMYAPYCLCACGAVNTQVSAWNVLCFMYKIFKLVIYTHTDIDIQI